MDIAAHLHGIYNRLVKATLNRQDLADFYLFSLVPPTYLEQWKMPDGETSALTYFQSIIANIRNEYIKRGMEELKDEAETTAWIKEIPEEDFPEELKPYYTYYESGYSGHYSGDPDEEEQEYPYSCEDCNQGLTEDELYNFRDTTYCEDCFDTHLTNALAEEAWYCTDDHKFVVPEELKEEAPNYPQNADTIESGEHQGHNLVSYQEGLEIDKDFHENQKKQMTLPLSYTGMFIRTYKDSSGNPWYWSDNEWVSDREQATLFTEKQKADFKHDSEDGISWIESSKCKRKLKKRAESGGAYYEAPSNFNGYTSYDYYLIFKHAPWKHSYGGPLWAEVARTINLMQKTGDWKELMVLIDHYNDLGHNTGKLLDKFPEWHQWLKKFLDEKASTHALQFLYPLASRPVATFISQYLRVSKIQDKPTVEKKPQKKKRERAHAELDVENITKMSDQYPGQQKAAPTGYPKPGMWYDPSIKESNDHTSVAEALKYFIQNPKVLGTPTHVSQSEKTVYFDNGKHLTFDEVVQHHQESNQKEATGNGFFDGPSDVGRDPDGDFPSVTWMPRGKEDLDVNDDDITAAAGVPLSLFNVQTAPVVIERLKKEVKVPYINAYPSTLGGPNNVSIMMTISTDAKETWANGILENSNYANFDISNDGTVEAFSGPLRFRKRRVKNVDDLIRVLNTLTQPAIPVTPVVPQQPEVTSAQGGLDLDRLKAAVEKYVSENKYDIDWFSDFGKKYVDYLRSEAQEAGKSLSDNTLNRILEEMDAEHWYELFGEDEVRQWLDTLQGINSEEDLKATYPQILKYYSPQMAMKFNSALESPISEDQKEQIAAKWGPEYISALEHYNEAIKNQHPDYLALEYAVVEMKKQMITIDPMILKQIVQAYLPKGAQYVG